MRLRSGKLLVLLVLGIGQSRAADLNPATKQGWDDYIRTVRARMDARLRPTGCFLWADEDLSRIDRLRQGEILVAPMADRGRQRIPGGLIHHWIGAMFLPNVSMAQVLTTLRDYRRYKEFYPSVVESKLTFRAGPVDRFNTLERHEAMFSKIALDADFSAAYVDAGDKRGYSISDTTRLQQIQNYGSPRQRELEPAAPKAYLWQLSSITRYLERDGGVYMELEGIALSRDIPASLRWLVEPFVRQAAVGAMTESLRETRQAVLGDEITGTGTVRPAGAAPAFRAR